ncbi:MAG: LCP family protein [Oscillospiraceae bacterium]
MPKHQQQRRRGRGRARLLLLLVFACITAAATYACVIRPPTRPAQKEHVGPVALPTPVEAPRTARKPDFYTILISGVDDGNGGSDTNILMAMDAKNSAIHCVSIPRDTKAMVDGRAHKINFAYNHGGSSLMAQTVSQQLGVPVDFTVSVDLQGFRALVDAIDGVDFDIPIDMNYDDPLQDLSIHFSKGRRHLNGQEALEVVRFRENNDGTGYGTQDLGRMATQQNFLKTVAKQTLQPGNLSKISEFSNLFQTYVTTDLTLGNLAWMGGEAMKMGAEHITFSTLPGEWKAPYIYLDGEAVLTLVNQSLNPYTTPRIATDLDILTP